MNKVINTLFVVTHLGIFALGAYKYIYNKPNSLLEIFSYFLFESVIIFYLVYYLIRKYKKNKELTNSTLLLILSSEITLYIILVFISLIYFAKSSDGYLIPGH